MENISTATDLGNTAVWTKTTPAALNAMTPAERERISAIAVEMRTAEEGRRLELSIKGGTTLSAFIRMEGPSIEEADALVASDTCARTASTWRARRRSHQERMVDAPTSHARGLRHGGRVMTVASLGFQNVGRRWRPRRHPSYRGGHAAGQRRGRCWPARYAERGERLDGEFFLAPCRMWTQGKRIYVYRARGARR